MTTYRIVAEDDPSPSDLQAVEEGLEAYNRAQTGVDDARRLAIFVRDGAGNVVGGLTGWTWWGWLSIDILWLAESVRHAGIGSQLVGQAEAEALARGCSGVILNTMSFQAPDFYRTLGYTEYATLDGFAGPHRRYYFTKRLHTSSDQGT